MIKAGIRTAQLLYSVPAGRSCGSSSLGHSTSNEMTIGVQDGGSGGAVAPPHFGQFVDINSGRVDIIRAKHNTCLINTL